MVIEKIQNVFNKIHGIINPEEGQFLYDCAKSCVKDGVIVEIGSAEGLSTVCLGLGSKDGNNVKVYSIDPHIGSCYTSDEDWIKTQNVNNEGSPDVKYYINQNTGYMQFYENIKKFNVDDVIIPISNYSEIAYKKGLGHQWNLPISLLWIDGDHRYNYVKMDIELWAKHVIPGGKIIFHDYPFPGVIKAVKETILNNSRYYDFKEVGKTPIVNVTVK